MRLVTASALLGSSLVSAAAIPNNTLAPPAPLTAFPSHNHKIIQPTELFDALASKGIEVLHNLTNTLAPLVEDVKKGLKIDTLHDKVDDTIDNLFNNKASVANTASTASTANKASQDGDLRANTLAAAATCTNPRVRTEWDSYSQSDRHAYVDAINCLRSRPASGQFPPAGNRYEDLVRLHQSVTPSVHDNAKFLVWHRYFLWVFEDILRSECGFDRNLPWWDEGRNTGKFAASSVFSSEYYGAIAINGACVSDGVFANTNLNIGPGEDNSPHCLSRAGNSQYTNQLNEDLVNAVNSWPEYKDMAYYAEGTFHAYGHLGVGGVQADKYASPGDAWFWLHHAYVDRNFANWQGGNPSARLNNINGNDHNGNPLTLDTMIYMNGLRPNVPVRDVMNVLGDKLCYTYQY